MEEIMSNIFNVDNAFFTLMGKVWDMICLSVVWAVLCFYSFYIMLILFPDESFYWVLPIFIIIQALTAGPATTALYYSVVKVVRKERGYALRSFFQSFKLNFKQGAITAVILLVAVYILYIDFQYTKALEETSTMSQVFFVGCITVSILLAAIAVFIFPILSRFTLKTFSLIKTTFLISMRHIFTTILLIIIVAVAILSVVILFPLILLIPSICMLLMSFLIERVFKRYMPKEENVEETGKDQWYLD